MSWTAAHLVDHVTPHVPMRQGVLWLPIPLLALLQQPHRPALEDAHAPRRAGHG
jgi:hypothetical protein